MRVSGVPDESGEVGQKAGGNGAPVSGRRAAISLSLLFAFWIPARTAGQNTEAGYDRPVSWKQLIPNIASDQKRIWLFPLKLGAAHNAIPTVSVLAATAGLVALDPFSASYFR